jgi:hypothetical protein
MDETIKKRMKNFHPEKKENLILDSHERLLTLRKKKIDNYINSKRIMNSNSNAKYEILLEDIPIDENILKEILIENDTEVTLP